MAYGEVSNAMLYHSMLWICLQDLIVVNISRRDILNSSGYVYSTLGSCAFKPFGIVRDETISKDHFYW